MKNLNLLFRRAHLYLGMLLIPWMFIYAFSTFIINHGPYFRQYRPGPDGWIQVWEKEYNSELPPTQPALREWAGGVLKENDLWGGPYGVQRNQQGAVINVPRFIKAMRITYRFSDQKLVAEQRETSWIDSLLRLHFRAGYGQVGFLQKVWGFVVDVVCMSFLVWVATGLYLWWKIPQVRKWGWVAIVSGMVSFVSVMLAL